MISVLRRELPNYIEIPNAVRATHLRNAHGKVNYTFESYLSQNRQGTSSIADKMIQKRTGATRYILERSVITSRLAGGAFRNCPRLRADTTGENRVHERDAFKTARSGMRNRVSFDTRAKIAPKIAKNVCTSPRRTAGRLAMVRRLGIT